MSESMCAKEEAMSGQNSNDTQRLSHAYIIFSASAENGLRTARELASAAVCIGTGEKPCGSCRACRKVQAGIHPDVINISRLSDEKGKLKREIVVEQVRQMAADAYVLPNEAERKVYIIREAELMNISAQNAALKLLEEPPEGVMFLLCTTNAGQLLPTVRSRCVEIGTPGDMQSADEDTLRLTADFLKAVASGDRAKLFAYCAANEGMDKNSAGAFFECALQYVSDMLCLRRGSMGMSQRELFRLTELLSRCSAYLRVNTGVKHIFGLLAVDAIADDGNRG